MRVVLDTNVLVSALLTPSGTPARIRAFWRTGRFTLLISDRQMQELHDTLEKPKLKVLIPSHLVGRLFNDLRRDAEVVRSSPHPNRSADPADNYLLGMAEAGSADYLVTGDKSHLLVLVRHQGTKILSARTFFDLLQ